MLASWYVYFKWANTYPVHLWVSRVESGSKGASPTSRGFSRIHLATAALGPSSHVRHVPVDVRICRRPSSPYLRLGMPLNCFMRSPQLTPQQQDQPRKCPDVNLIQIWFFAKIGVETFPCSGENTYFSKTHGQGSHEDYALPRPSIVTPPWRWALEGRPVSLQPKRGEGKGPQRFGGPVWARCV